MVNAALRARIDAVGERETLYERAVAELAPALSRVAAGYEADPELRRDLLQDMHAALWHSLARFDGRCSLKTWTWRVAHNVGATHLGRHKKHRLVELDELPVEADLEQRVDTARALEKLSRLIHALAPADRQLVLLYLEGLEASVIAEVTGLSPSNVATRVHRLKAALARQFQEGAR